MSDSSSISNSPPSDAALEEALRSVVRTIYKNGNLEDLTVKRVRSSAENDLDLQKDFFKDHPSWKDRSKSIIQAEVEAHPEPATSQVSPPKESPRKKSPPIPIKTSAIKSQSGDQKRSSTGDTGSKKRRKKNDEAVDASSSEAQPRQPKPEQKLPRSQSPLPEQNSAESVAQNELGDNAIPTVNGSNQANSESEMSVVLDEEPKPKRKRRSGGSERVEKTKPKKASASKTSKPDSTADPDTEEIKRLQGWLVKCGIRKMWWKELQPYDTPKAKIRHLKDMLSDAGMAGRYSNEKAIEIRESRELKADLEAVQAGNEKWGKAGSEDEVTGRPKRRLARGFESFDFLNDDDGEETD